MKELIKKKILDIYITDDKKYIIFSPSLSDYVCYQVLGDCCSESYWESIVNRDALIGQYITGYEDKDLIGTSGEDSEEISDCENNVNKLYGITLKTEKGHIDLTFRNESNGYYGGSYEKIHLIKCFGKLDNSSYLKFQIVDTNKDKFYDFNVSEIQAKPWLENSSTD